jgi:D-glycero-D-manno-heptose 1,7-bisphosphate phosphatase
MCRGCSGESPRAPRRPRVALDRDGTIIVERHYLSDPGGVELLPGVGAGLQHLHELGLGLIVVTNQSAIGRGLFDEAQLARARHRHGTAMATGLKWVRHCVTYYYR